MGEGIVSRTNPELGDIVVNRDNRTPISAIVENIQTLPSPRLIVRSIRDNRVFALPVSTLGVTWDIVT
jgi:hypothetical protein